MNDKDKQQQAKTLNDRVKGMTPAELEAYLRDRLGDDVYDDPFDGLA